MTAVVTGGGRGIGRAIAQTFAHAGAFVVVCARSRDELDETVTSIVERGGRARAIVLDVTNPRAVDAVMAAVGPIDILVNNAGVAGPFGPLWESNLDDWWRAIDVNARGPWLTMRAALPGMIGRRRGRVINLVTGMGSMAYLSAYQTSKTALVRLTECVALEAKPYGVTAFAMSPGTVRTAMAEQALGTAEGQRWLPWFRRIFDQGLDIPPERSAHLALTLASGKVDALTGRYLSPYDDLNLLLSQLEEVERGHLYELRVTTHPADRPHPLTNAGLSANGPR